MTGIFSESDKKDIINEVRTKYQYKSEVEFNEYVQVIAGLRIIDKILGNEWYQKAKNDIVNNTNSDSAKDHPIAYFLKFNQPEKMVRLLNFANMLRNLYGKTNLEEKIQNYVRKEKRASITTESFEKLYTELKVASYFSQRGLQVKFLKEVKSSKTPDIQVDAKDGLAVVECKRKKYQGSFFIESVIDSILDANTQLTDSKIPGIIYVDIPITPSGPKVDTKFKDTKLESIYPQLKTVHYIMIAGEWSIIAEPGRAYTKSHMFTFENKMSDLKLSPTIEDLMRDITHPPPRSLLED